MNRQQPGSTFGVRPPARAAAFSLVELLIVTAILGVVIGVLAACIAGGLRVWDTAQTFQNAEADAVLGLEILERDVGNAVPFFGVPFDGDAEGMVLPALVDDATGRLRPGTVRYRYDRAGGRLLRTAWVFPGEPPDALGGEAVCTRLRGLEWEFCVVEERRDEAGPAARPGETGETESADRMARWTGEATNLPAAVRIRLTLEQDETPQRLERTIVRAAGGEQRVVEEEKR
jgi:type II secretory pathway pseudopilin PulG